MEHCHVEYSSPNKDSLVSCFSVQMNCGLQVLSNREREEKKKMRKEGFRGEMGKDIVRENGESD